MPPAICPSRRKSYCGTEQNGRPRGMRQSRTLAASSPDEVETCPPLPTHSEISQAWNRVQDYSGYTQIVTNTTLETHLLLITTVTQAQSYDHEIMLRAFTDAGILACLEASKSREVE